MNARVASATDTIFAIQKTSAQDVDAFLTRSDYPYLYHPDEVQDAFDDGWHHFYDEPDLLHKTTPRGMTFSIHTNHSDLYGYPHYMILHNPEGVSKVGEFGSLPEAMSAQREIESNPSRMKDLLRPDPVQSKFVGLMHDAGKAEDGVTYDENGLDWTADQARRQLDRMKASEDAIGAGGHSLVDNFKHEYQRRGLNDG